MNNGELSELPPEFQLRPLTAVCKKYPEIAFAYLFGSRATNEQTAMSDVDLALYHSEAPPAEPVAS